ncbi:MAG TPA: L-threonylcarbamoyladenylate synthase [Gammaproteobacteria bacterium]|nr:L-threonylcarbamoyladenylate synthase [Gammaproteobacteria bacterium]
MPTIITQAAALLRAGKLVAFPTETVYGLGADAMNATAVARIFQVKKRPFDHPVIVHLADRSELPHWVDEIPPDAMKLMQTFWPGPLTILLKKRSHIPDIITAGQSSIGLRIPNHPIAQALLREFGKGIAAPSANQFTHVSPTTAEAVREELGHEVDLIIDGGACELGLESTIIDMSCEQAIVLRPGMITTQAITEVLGSPVIIKRQDMPIMRAPGMHHVHYAPKTKTVIVATEQLNHFLSTFTTNDLPIALVRYTKHRLPHAFSINSELFARTVIVTMPNDAIQYAHDLYHTLRSLDAGQYKQIVIEAVPMNEAWEAIRDRLLRASGLFK